jgi:hypothetical protein
MDDQTFQILSVSQARRILTNGDIRSDVAFQHEVNRLLASLDELCDSDSDGDRAAAQAARR